MPFPTDSLIVKVEFAFGADLKATPATWVYTDRTVDWQPDRMLAATIGRADATSRPQTAKLGFWLKNGAGKYTKGNPMSPYWPYIRKNTPCRITIDPGTGHTRVYEMYVTQWIPRWGSSGDSGRQPLVQVVANGVRRRLSQGASPLRSPVHRAAAALGPLVHWALDDGSDATQAGSALTGGAPLTVSNKVTFSSIDTPVGDKAPELIGGRLTGTCPPGVSTTGFSVHFAARMVQSDPAQSSVIWPVSVQSTDGRLWTWNISQAAAGAAGALVGEQSNPGPLASGAAGTVVRAPLGFTPFDGKWHSYFLVATKVSATTVLLEAYFDGRSCSGTTVGGSVTLAPIGGPITIPDETYQTISRVASLSVEHVAVYDAPLGQVAAQQLASAVQGWAGETAGQRIRRLCTEEGVAFPASAPVTLVTEGFEGTTYAITMTGTWADDSSQSHSGAWSRKSATTADGGQSDMVVTVPAGATSMSVWYKVSSESGGDYLQILRDGVPDLRASGEVGWTQRTIDVVGVKQVTFRYLKDGAVAAGLDAAYVDDIAFIKDPTLTDLLDTAKMGPQKAGQFVGLLDEAQDVDGGLLLDGLSPGFKYLRRIDAYNLPPALTIDMAGRQFRAPFEPLDDDASVVNDASVTRTGGSSARYVDEDGPAGTDAIERYDDSRTLNIYSDADLLAQAAWRTHLGTAGADALRFPGIGFNLHELGGSALIESWLTSGVRTRQQVTHPPAEYGPGPIDLLVEGYTETVRSRRVWSVAANTSPYAPWRVFVVGQDRIDGDGYQLAAGVTATATTLSVKSTTGLLWVTTAIDASAFPLDVEVAGIRLRVTGISGTSSPQTFTVQRSMDGFDKALGINEPVRLWRPPVIAL